MSDSPEQSRCLKRRSSLDSPPIYNNNSNNSHNSSHKKKRIDDLFSNDITELNAPPPPFWHFGSDNGAADEEEEEEDDQPYQRSLHSALVLSSNIGDENDYSERRKSVHLLQDVDEEEDEDELTTIPISRHQADFDDEVDAFFSSSCRNNHDPAEFVLSSSHKMSLLQQTRGSNPPFYTAWPHFLTTDYFQTHGPNDRMIPNNNSNNTTTPYFDATFEIMGRLDSGEYSDVWKARETVTRLVCAIKKLKVNYMSWDHRWEQITEVEHLLKLQRSKHCVELLNAWEQEGFLYLQMELCSRGSLEKYIKLQNRKIKQQIIWDLMYEILLGVRDIHEQDLVHLDLKPSNLLIDDNGFLKIADFGVSVQVPADHKWVRGEGDRRYMAPDLLREQFDKPADIFSLGMILLELATGITLPEEGESWENLRLGDFSEMEAHLSSLPQDMSNMIKWLLTAEPASRPNIHAVLESGPFKQRSLVSDTNNSNKKGTLYHYVQESDNNASFILRDQQQEGEREGEESDKCIGSQTLYSTPEARVY